jgi:hydroxyacyl-ACP dehydratase HTD2-like protein with hotdog domain
MFAAVGIFSVIVLATALFQRIVQRHIRTWDFVSLPPDYPVTDLSICRERISHMLPFF